MSGARLGTLLLTVALVACSAPDENAYAPAPRRSHDYAFTDLSVDDNNAQGQPHTGFNLDGRFSGRPLQPADCGHRDFFSALDRDQNENGCDGTDSACRGGVDNQLSAFGGVLESLQVILGDEIRAGRTVILLRLDGVYSLYDDIDLGASLVVGHPLFSDCAAIETPDQPYAVDAASLLNGVARFRYRASIVHGRLRLRAADRVSPPAPSYPADPLSTASLWRAPFARMHAMQLRVTLTPLNGTDGNLGGYLTARELNDAFNPSRIGDSANRFFDSLIPTLIDLPTEGACDAMHSGSIGLGFGFRLTRARIDPTPVTTALPGMCGTPKAP